MSDEKTTKQVWIDRCRTLLDGNRIQSNSFRYTRPAPHVYEYQWLWDSCFHAIIYRHFDGGMAWDELLSLVHHQAQDSADAGMIPHMAYWQGDGAEMWSEAYRSTITQPPLIATAARLVHEKHPNVDNLKALYPKLVAYQEWMTRRRELDDDDLVTLIHPWESGWDASPRWDAAMGLQNPSADTSKAARHALVAVLQEYGYDAKALRQAGSFSVKAADYNAIRATELEAMAKIATLLNDTAEATRWTQKAQSIQTSLREKSLRQHEGHWIAHDLAGANEAIQSPDSAAKFVLLYGGCVTEEQAAALVHELQRDIFSPRFPVPTTPTDSPAFAGDTYWRGNVWLPINWLIVRGLERYGYIQAAERLAERSLELVQQTGFSEYFNPLTGEGYGPNQQSWSAIVLDFV